MFAKKIRNLRALLDWTQKELAEYLKTSQAVVSHWENGLHTANAAKLVKLKKLCLKKDIPIKFGD